MKNKLLLALLLLFVPIFITACGAKPKTNDTSDKTTGEETVNTNLLDLVKQGKTLKCSFVTSSSAGESSGTTYVSGSYSRSDFTSKLADNTTMESHTITDGTYIYIWTAGSPQGTKMKIADLSDKSTTTKVDTVSNSVDFKCAPWRVDSSLFAVPTDITFADLTEMFKQFQNNSGTSQYCSICEQAGSADKIAECKKNLNCN